jgi:hypothetical protein
MRRVRAVDVSHPLPAKVEHLAVGEWPRRSVSSLSDSKPPVIPSPAERTPAVALDPQSVTAGNYLLNRVRAGGREGRGKQFLCPGPGVWTAGP